MKLILIMYHRLKCLTLHAGLALGILFRHCGKDDIYHENYSSNSQLIRACIKIQTPSQSLDFILKSSLAVLVGPSFC